MQKGNSGYNHGWIKSNYARTPKDLHIGPRKVGWKQNSIFLDLGINQKKFAEHLQVDTITTYRLCDNKATFVITYSHFPIIYQSKNL